MSLKVLTIVGTRPEIIRLSRVMHELDKHFNHIIVHTGQNYDYELNEIFFKELGLRKPDFFLNTATKNVAGTIGNIINFSDELLEKEKPDAVIFYGDTNSCLAVISAKKFVIEKFKSLILDSKAIIVLNEKEKKSVVDVLPSIKNKVYVISNGLDMSEYKNIQTLNLHKCYNIPENHKIIIFLGRIFWQKGLDLALKSLSKIKDKLNFTFLIVGPDEGEKNNLEKISQKLKLQDRIIFTGLISGERKLRTLKSADLSFLYSRSEGLPTSLLESAALGLPIICSTASNLPEVEKFKAGFVVRTESEAAKMIKQVLENNQLSQNLSKNALKLAKNFDIKICVKKLNHIYEQII